MVYALLLLLLLLRLLLLRQIVRVHVRELIGRPLFSSARRCFHMLLSWVSSAFACISSLSSTYSCFFTITGTGSFVSWKCAVPRPRSLTLSAGHYWRCQPVRLE